jgi:hypothetical protein
MINALRKFLLPKSKDESVSDLTVLPEAPANEQGRGRWLVEFVVKARELLGVTSAVGLPLCGSIGFEATLLSDGDVVWHEYDIANEAPDEWRVASREERISAIVIALKRMPQLSVPLPARGPSDRDCANCEAVGTLVGGRVVCSTCGGLGWRPAA